MQCEEKDLFDKIRSLPPEKLAEVADFVDFLYQREQARLTQASSALSEDSFRRIWDNTEDAVYDTL